MPDLIVVAFDSEAGADEARASLNELPEEQVMLIDDAMTLTNASPQTAALHQARSRTSRLVTWPRAILGSAFTGACLVTAWLIAETGSIGGSLIRGRKQLDHGTVKKLDKKLRNASSALVLVVRDSIPDEMLATLGEYDDDMMHAELSRDNAKRLQKILE